MQTFFSPTCASLDLSVWVTEFYLFGFDSQIFKNVMFLLEATKTNFLLRESFIKKKFCQSISKFVQIFIITKIQRYFIET